ncbi:hypothetical protein F0562_032410 [Nyssa sinensis]|uniref:Uncharacterized protein n=1 Tax=Nyssa sinensis TaxID=561372 RepID=A0A5J5AMJ8_9ASTE|nr:hypothetical protein F0562_032410 [Nyssa sinensis]
MVGHATQAMATILDDPKDTKRVKRLQAKLETTCTKLKASRAAVHSLEEKCESLDGKYKEAVTAEGVIVEDVVPISEVAPMDIE